MTPPTEMDLGCGLPAERDLGYDLSLVRNLRCDLSQISLVINFPCSSSGYSWMTSFKPQNPFWEERGCRQYHLHYGWRHWGSRGVWQWPSQGAELGMVCLTTPLSSLEARSWAPAGWQAPFSLKILWLKCPSFMVKKSPWTFFHD